jgi:hypothetical protein
MGMKVKVEGLDISPCTCSPVVFISNYTDYDRYYSAVDDVQKACDRFTEQGVQFKKRPEDGKMRHIALYVSFPSLSSLPPLPFSLHFCPTFVLLFSGYLFDTFSLCGGRMIVSTTPIGTGSRSSLRRCKPFRL